MVSCALRSMGQVLSILMFAAAIHFVAGCERRSPQTTEPSKSDLEEQPAHESWGTEFYVSRDAIPLVRIRSPYSRRYEREDSTLTVLTSTSDARVVADIFDDFGEKTATVHADEIRYVEEQRRFDAFGGVEVVTEEGRRVETEHLFWNEDTEMIHAPGFAQVYAPDEFIQGYELEAREDLSSYSLARVTGHVFVDE